MIPHFFKTATLPYKINCLEQVMAPIQNVRQAYGPMNDLIYPMEYLLGDTLDSHLRNRLTGLAKGIGDKSNIVLPTCITWPGVEYWVSAYLAALAGMHT